jgi:hypothetical protein
MRIRTTGRRSCFMGCDVTKAKRECQTILDVAHWLPEDVLQEDSALLMYFDNAGMRVNG